jgi:hypothetical protein
LDPVAFYRIEPEVAGGLGDRTVFCATDGPHQVKHLHYVFDDWLGDSIVTSTPCFLCTQQLADEIVKHGLTGVYVCDAEIEVSPLFIELNPNAYLPKFLQLVPSNHPGQKDFGIDDNLHLIVSSKALDVIRSCGFSKDNLIIAV